MFGRRIDLFTLLGFRVSLDPSWFIVAILLTWSLATGYFPANFAGLGPTSYWLMGFAGAFGLFASVLLHELGHAWVAQREGLPMKGITLFIFGGIAEMSGEPSSPRVEFRVAIAGPIVSILISLACYGAVTVGRMGGWPLQADAVISYLAYINLFLVLFNSVPAFPLDGGRVLRAVLWAWKDNPRWATDVTARLGAAFGTLLMLLGLMTVLFNNFVAGLWLFLIGLFLKGAAQASFQHFLLREVLQGEPVHRLMNDRPVTVPRALSIRDLVEDYVYHYHHKFFPVTDGENVIGFVTTRHIRQVPKEEWEQQSVSAITQVFEAQHTIQADEDALVALTRMSRGGQSRLMVMKRDHLVGILSLKDLLEFFRAKLELDRPLHG